MEFEKWIAEQTEDVRTSYEQHVAGLKTALKTERDAGKALQEQVKGATDRAAAAASAEEKVIELQTKVTELENRTATTDQELETARGELVNVTRQHGFWKEAVSRGIDNPDNAFLIAKGKNLVSDEGTLDWNAFAKMAPEQFVRTNPSNPARGRTITLEDVRKMTPAEYEQHRDEVNAVLAQSGI